ncbi:MAG: TRAP transporter small permease [Pseudomonadota bacterium]|nr:TRAP transporter small permease [Pseudomonadota bacterium]
MLAFVAMLLLCVLIVDMMYEVVSRRVFSAPTLWAYDIAYMANGVGFLLAAGYTLRQRGHIRIDFLSARLPGRYQDLINGFVYILLVFPALTFMLIGTYTGWIEAYMTDQLDPVSPWKPLLWPLFAGMLIGVASFFLQTIVECIRHFRSVLGWDISPLHPVEQDEVNDPRG